MTRRAAQGGYTLIELIVSIGIAAMLLTGLQQLLGIGIETMEVVEGRTEQSRQARFAMSRMVDAVHQSERLLLPLSNNPATPFDENVREQTVPASPPQSGSTLATAVLAITVSPVQDMDGDGIFDADNDGDGQIDEDPSGDVNNDLAPGVFAIDDDGDGSVDEEHTQAWNGKMGPLYEDDDEDDFANENNWVGFDNDGDGSIDEDPKKDVSDDALAGLAGVDDDGDSLIDEGDKNDDDEDGLVDEDWLDLVVFYLQGTTLWERRAAPWDVNADTVINGRDYVESAIADNVTLLRYERVPLNGGQQLVDITLGLTNANGETINLNTQVHLGSLR